MKRIVFYVLIYLAFLCRLFSGKWYMHLVIAAHKSQGVLFKGRPEYIAKDAHLDASGGLTLNKGVVISTRVIVLSHDWSFLKRIDQSKNIPKDAAFKPVFVGENTFIGAGAIILPGTKIGNNCIIGAGAVVKGVIDDYSIVAGNPAKIIGDTRK